jgi:hypothetical protein
MDQKRLVELWSRLLVGETLPPAEEQELFDCLASQPGVRQEFLADESTDSLLRHLGQIDKADDDFVQRVMRRTTAITRDAKTPDRSPSLPERIELDIDAADNDRPLAIRTAWDNVRRKKRRDRIWRTVTLAACCAAAAVIILIARLSPTPDNRVANAPVPPKHETPLKSETPQKNESPRKNETPRHSSPVVPEIKPDVLPKLPVVEPVGLASLVNSAGAQWKSPPRKDGRLLAGELELLAGKAELRFDNGAVVQLSGPIALDLRRVDDVFLKKGTLTAKIPPQAIGFSVFTPTSRIIDLGTEFKVDVAASGASDTSVLKGKVSVEPQHNGKPAGERVSLEAGDLNRASTWQPDVQAAMLPVFVSVSGPKAQFFGTINCNGSTAAFHSQQMFKTFETRTVKRLKAAPDRFGADWQILIRTFSSGGSSSSRIEVNSKRMDIKKFNDALMSPEEMMRNFDKMMPMPKSPTGSSTKSQGSFHYFLIIDGKRVDFNSKEEYDAAFKKMTDEHMKH